MIETQRLKTEGHDLFSVVWRIRDSSLFRVSRFALRVRRRGAGFPRGIMGRAEILRLAAGLAGGSCRGYTGPAYAGGRLVVVRAALRRA
jgi:hypothetical protein